ncbi:unnamed protein product [Hymenolepis diminuta]|uniref:Zinc finger protein n=1 Tax=Hymenolepis diminuta TaxID=6216 RepID=A0A0R3SRJ2_HYMDI|nr:unnamed protein product [Hymenolepis diminuta]VUZ57602.1 unnamed protein product [Hymenolepis diminuta]
MNINEPQDMSMRSSASPTLSNSPTMQQSPTIAVQNALSTDTITQMFLQLMQQFQHQMFQPQETKSTSLPDNRELERIIRKTILDHLTNKNSKIIIHGELKITVDSDAPVTVKINTPLGTSSKRKSYTPVRILPVVPPSPDYTSTDSGVLDLSCSGSVHSNESSPITPLKPDFPSMLHMQHGNHDSPGKMKSASKRRFTGGRRNFPCNQCNEMEFHSLQQLEEHTMQTHGSYRCHVCSRTFTQRSNLQRHALKHVGFKPFRCGVCLQGYYRKDHLMRHMEVNHPTVNPLENIQVFLTSSQSLDYLSTNQSTGCSSPLHGLVNPEQPTCNDHVEQQQCPLN